MQRGSLFQTIIAREQNKQKSHTDKLTVHVKFPEIYPSFCDFITEEVLLLGYIKITNKAEQQKQKRKV